MIGDLIGLVGKFIPDKSKAAELEAKIQEAHSKALSKAVEADKDIKIAELKKGGLAAIWRPIGALSIFATLFLHWFIFPLVKVVIVAGNYNSYMPQLEPLPTNFYGLALAFISIYAYGRSMNKRN